MLAGPIETDRAVIYLRFIVSFVLSGLIALTYSYFGVVYVALRVLYPQLWSDPADARAQAQQELPPSPGNSASISPWPCSFPWAAPVCSSSPLPTSSR